MCIQRDPFRRDLEIDGSEDCLYLNVYSPEVVEKPLPVMVFFHGGGFMVIQTFVSSLETRNQH
jgi:carboxylesterase type B